MNTTRLILSCAFVCAGSCTGLVAQERGTIRPFDRNPWNHVGHNRSAADSANRVGSPPLPLTGSTLLRLLSNEPDVATLDVTNWIHWESSVALDPVDPDFTINSNNSRNTSTGVTQANYTMSTNGGALWSGSTSGPGGTNLGDPAVAIDRDGRYFVGFIGDGRGQQVAYSTDRGATWTRQDVRTTSSGLLDKNHLCVDNSINSPYEGYVYSAWTRSIDEDPNDGQIEVRRSTDAGANWSASSFLSAPISGVGWQQGVNLRTGPDGNAYACWAVYTGSSAGKEVAIGFGKSTDGGGTWSSSTAITNIRGIRYDNSVQTQELDGDKDMWTASFPAMAVDRHSGSIYIVWTNLGPPGTNTGDPDNYIIRSDDEGTTWTALPNPVRINQDAGTDDQWHPWVACDDVSGAVVVIFFDSRANSDMAETYVAVSYNKGATWTEEVVSDDDWAADGRTNSPSTNPSFYNYVGSYMGIDCRHCHVMPLFYSDHSGRLLSYTSPYSLECPASVTLGRSEVFQEAMHSVSQTLTVAPPSGQTYRVLGQTTSNVVHRAGTEIVLKSGFEVLANATYVAEIRSCSTYCDKGTFGYTTIRLAEEREKISRSERVRDMRTNALPNPANRRLWLRFQTSPYETANVDVYDGTGRLVWRGAFKANGFGGEGSVEVPVAEWAPGAYAYIVKRSGNVEFGRFVVVH